MKIRIDCMVGKRHIQIVEDLNWDSELSFGDRYELLVDSQFEGSSNSVWELADMYDLPKWLIFDYEENFQ